MKFTDGSDWAGNVRRMTIPADMGHKTGPRPRLRLQSKLCLRVIWTCCWQQKGHDFNTDGMNAALFLAAQCGLVQCCWHRSFYTTGLWVNEISQQPYFVCSSSLRLSPSAPSFHTSSKRTFYTFWPCRLWVFPGCFYSVIPKQFERSNFSAFHRQRSGHCIYSYTDRLS